MLRYFISINNVLKEVPRYWEKHYTVGNMESEYQENNTYFILRLKDFEVDPIICSYLSGYYLGVTELVKNFKNLKVEELKCIHKGGDYHEFIIKWN
jgi:hypothetical protein